MNASTSNFNLSQGLFSSTYRVDDSTWKRSTYTRSERAVGKGTIPWNSIEWTLFPPSDGRVVFLFLPLFFDSTSIKLFPNRDQIWTNPVEMWNFRFSSLHWTHPPALSLSLSLSLCIFKKKKWCTSGILIRFPSNSRTRTSLGSVTQFPPEVDDGRARAFACVELLFDTSGLERISSVFIFFLRKFQGLQSVCVFFYAFVSLVFRQTQNCK